MNILYLPPIPYSGLRQRPQLLAEEIAKQHRVLYLDPTVSLMKYLWKGGEKPSGYTYAVSDALQMRRLNGWFSAHRSLEGIAGVFAWPEKAQLRGLLRKADAVWIGYAPWFDLVKNFRGKIVYDKMDEDILITQNRLLQRLIRKLEPDLIRRADAIFVTADAFARQMRSCGKEAILLPNAAEEINFGEISPHPLPVPAGSVVFGYVGMISHWFDMDAVRRILDADERNFVVLAGPCEIEQYRHERLIWLGRVEKREAMRYIKAFDVCLFPFARGGLSDTIDPVKIYEYLAENKPVLSVRSAETEKFGSLLQLYGNPEELTELLARREWRRPFRTEEARRQFSEDNSWRQRGITVCRKLAEWKA